MGLHWITTFGLGRLRPAPGTWGSLPPILLALALHAAGLGPNHTPLLFSTVFGVLALIFAVACIVQGDAAEARWGKDPSNAVADETAGQCLPLMFLPAATFASWPLALFTLALAFVSFRLLDIVKPWPAHQVQRLPAGWGILLDDLLAGLYAAAIVQVCARWAL
ncbi:MAG: phosphatidylglycerophosphatase A [Phycisphaerae bacterium]|nr:MAG: phosphatidylglycerophosphatase A [Phycisphaerae bacterium]